MSNLLFSLLTQIALRTKEGFVRQTGHLEATQTQFLLTLLKTYQNTVLGQHWKFEEIKTVEQFRERVPVLSYGFYHPYVDQIAQGQANILTSEPVVYLNLSSGTTGKHKLIPVTKRSRKNRQIINQVAQGFLAEAVQKRQISLGKMLLTSSLQLTGYTEAGIPCGPVSVGDLRLSNFLYKQIFVHPYEALKPSDDLARHYVCLLFALQYPNLGIFGANFPVLALRLADYLEKNALELIQDLEKGTIAEWLTLEPELRGILTKQLTPQPGRAAHLREILHSEGRLTPQLVWPSIGCLVTARGGTSDFYFQRFSDYFGNTPIFGGIYAASEGAFGVYHDLDNDGAILAINTGFYEFIPSDQWDVEQPKTLLPQDLKVGEQYRILVSNYNGLYRYDVGDVVEVVGFYHQTPMITFKYRYKGLLSSTTEKTTEYHVIQVMGQLQQEFSLPLENFCITLSEKEIPPHYLVNIELRSGHFLPNPQQFVTQFDYKLREIHTSYAVKRNNSQVPPPRLRILAPGSFAKLRQHLLDKGMPESQLKFPHISEDRQFLTGLNVEKEVHP
ncbi:GH3 auxin-responsive promoter [Gloeothece citriformis PCC 7424]|uniref:GH3 auxin-responsive promoter n=1 Tax=Gloeothece citriformis (strain PCC 7424) TaxID=65393 RepID=B7KA27_GLOC7|nr:GH3 auxin-responsive promoter family protein [Gloeothece citriformis]ACK71383.1 GH3 auxin-responsive promoter [Gloeothece citriformis PCC 7424]